MLSKPNTLYLLSILSLFSFASCDDDGGEPEPDLPLEAQTATDVHADEGFAFYDLESGQMLSKEDSTGTEWDLAFSGSTILTNSGVSGPGQGGAQIVAGLFDEFTAAPADGYDVDTADSLAIVSGSGNGWYNYTGFEEPQHAIFPIPGRIIMLKTGEGNYAKVEIISYYEGNPDTTTDEFASLETRPASGYFTFQYMVQPDGSTELE